MNTTRPYDILPHEPESIESAKARLPAALENILTEAEQLRRLKVGDGPRRREVFDFIGGLRLIITRERLGDAPPAIHLSASVVCGSLHDDMSKRNPRTRMLAFAKKLHPFIEGMGLSHLHFEMMFGTDGISTLHLFEMDKSKDEWKAEHPRAEESAI